MTAENVKYFIDIVDLEPCQQLTHNEQCLSDYIETTNKACQEWAKSNNECLFSIYAIQKKDPIRHFATINDFTDLYSFEFKNETAYSCLNNGKIFRV